MIDSIPPIDSNNVNTISQIANLCPDIYGEAVYNARTLLAAMGIEEQYDDDMICNAGLRTAKTDDPISNIVEEANAYLKSQEIVSSIDSKNVSIYPNPAEDEININYADIDPNSQFTILNEIGCKVLAAKINTTEGSQKIDISKLPNGIYLCTLSSGTSQKIIGKLNIIKH